MPVLVRGDWRRSRTQTASRMEVFPWALSPVKSVMPPPRAQESVGKQRKSRRRREVRDKGGKMESVAASPIERASPDVESEILRIGAGIREGGNALQGERGRVG